MTLVTMHACCVSQSTAKTRFKRDWWFWCRFVSNLLEYMCAHNYFTVHTFWQSYCRNKVVHSVNVSVMTTCICNIRFYVVHIKVTNHKTLILLYKQKKWRNTMHDLGQYDIQVFVPVARFGLKCCLTFEWCAFNQALVFNSLSHFVL